MLPVAFLTQSIDSMDQNISKFIAPNFMNNAYTHYLIRFLVKSLLTQRNFHWPNHRIQSKIGAHFTWFRNNEKKLAVNFWAVGIHAFNFREEKNTHLHIKSWSKCVRILKNLSDDIDLFAWIWFTCVIDFSNICCCF